jgi:hypothetical protein
MGDEVRLVDLEVIKRYSLAVRQEAVPAEELLEVLDLTREAVVAALGEQRPARRRAARSSAKGKQATDGKVAARRKAGS